MEHEWKYQHEVLCLGNAKSKKGRNSFAVTQKKRKFAIGKNI